MTYLLGIDLGTTRTSAVVSHPGARPGEVVHLGDRASAVPSVVYAAADGSVLVGEVAERRALGDPSRVVREFKRRIGDPTPIVVDGVPWSPQELAARLVRWVVERVAEREGAQAARVAVTHPASWGPHKRDLLGGALAVQGLQVSFLAEPQAAALHYASGERLEAGSTIAVYDLGGGTFDAAVVYKDVSRFDLIGRPEGLDRLGGVDFDQSVFDHVRASMPEAFANLDDDDPAVRSAVAAVRRECCEAKEALSVDTEVAIPVLLPDAQGSVRLHRSEFEALIRPQIDETISALRRAVVSAALTSEQLTSVLLVGGSSRIPLVAQLVSEQLGRPVTVDADPKNAIALGAALHLDRAARGGTGAQVPVPRAGGPMPYPVGAGQRGPAATGAWSPGATGAPVLTGAAMSDTLGSGGLRPPRVPVGPTRQPLAVQHEGVPTRGAGPPPRPAAYPERPPIDDGGHDPEYEYERPEPPRHRSPALLVGIGGAVAAVGVLATVLLMPAAQPEAASGGAQTSIPALPPVDSSTTPTRTTTDDAEPTDEPDDDPTPDRTPRPTPVEPEPTVTIEPTTPSLNPTITTPTPTPTPTTTTPTSVEPPPPPPPVEPSPGGGEGPAS